MNQKTAGARELVGLRREHDDIELHVGGETPHAREEVVEGVGDDEVGTLLLESLDGIRGAMHTYQTTAFPEKLARYHASQAATDALFDAWASTWLSPEFADWQIDDMLADIACPVLAIQGEDDEYATMAHIERVAAAAADVDVLKLADCRHSPHKDQLDAVLESVQTFVNRLYD